MNKIQQLLYEVKEGIPTDVRIAQSFNIGLSAGHDIRKLYEAHVQEASKRGIKPISCLNDFIGLLVQASKIQTEPYKNTNELIENGIKLNRMYGKLLGIIPPVKQYD